MQKQQPDAPPALLTLDLICRHYLPLSKRTIHRMVARGDFPPADIQRGKKMRLWKKETAQDWVDAQTTGK